MQKAQLQDQSKVPSLCSRAKNVTPPPPPVRFFAPDAPVVDLYLGQIDQVERLRSVAEVSLVFFYAPWCAHSMAARQELQQVAKKLARQVTRNQSHNQQGRPQTTSDRFFFFSETGAVCGCELLVESGEMQKAESLFSVSQHPSVLQEVIQETLALTERFTLMGGKVRRLLDTASAGSQFGNVLEH